MMKAQLRLTCAVTLLLSGTSPLWAQTVPPQIGDASVDTGGEIIVTARKRAETAFDTPVVLQAVGGEELSRRSITNVEGLSRVTPLLLIGENTGGVQGGFNRSSQRQEIGGCEHGRSKSIGTLHPREAGFTRASICLAT